MTYVTSVERIGIQKGLEQGIVQGMQQGQLTSKREDILDILEARFANVPAEVAQHIHQISDFVLLKSLHRQAILAPTLAEFVQQLAEVTAANPET